MRRIRAAIAAFALVVVCAPGAIAQRSPSVSFVVPAAGTRVTGPQVHVRLAVAGLTLVDAGSPVRSGEGHAHLFVDRTAVRPGEAIPTDQSTVVHLGKAPFDTRTLPLPDGRHTLTAQLANSSHVALPAATARLTFTVVTPKPSVAIVAPTQGTTVAGPKVEVWLSIENLRPTDAGQPNAPGEGHAHVFVDRDPMRPGEAIPTDQPTIVHFGKSPYDARALPLGDGAHTIWAQLADSGHVALDVATPRATFTVAPGYRGKGTLEPACAEVAQGSSDARLIFPLSGGLVQGSISSACAFQTEGGACSWSALSTRRVLGLFDQRSGALTASVYGSTERRLQSGTSSRCGSGSVVSEPPGTMSATLAGDTVDGTIGLARIVVRSDPSVVLEAPTVAVGLTGAPTAEPAARPGGSEPAGVPVATVGAGAAVIVVLALAGALILRSRRAPPTIRAAPAAPAVPDRTPVDACSACGAPRRAAARFCHRCGQRF